MKYKIPLLGYLIFHEQKMSSLLNMMKLQMLRKWCQTALIDMFLMRLFVKTFDTTEQSRANQQKMYKNVW